MVACHCSSVADTIDTGWPSPPAVATRSSTGPTSSASAATDAESVSSAGTARAPGPSPARTDSSAATSRPVIATAAPASARWRAIAAPMPRDAPVTSAVAPVTPGRFVVMVGLLRRRQRVLPAIMYATGLPRPPAPNSELEREARPVDAFLRFAPLPPQHVGEREEPLRHPFERVEQGQPDHDRQRGREDHRHRD